MSDDADFDTTRRNTPDGIEIRVKLKRGEGTRDQDTVTAKVKRSTVDEAVEDVERLKPHLADVVDDVRDMQPGDDADGGVSNK